MAADGSKPYKLYPERWLILATCASLSCTNIMQWCGLSAMIGQTDGYYCSVDSDHTCKASYVSNQIFQLRLAAALNFLGALIRVVSAVPTIQDATWRQALLHTGTMVAASAQTLYFVVVAKITESWFPPHKRATANVLTTNCIPLGIIVGTLTPSLIFEEDDVTRVDTTSWQMFIFTAVMCVLCVLPLALSLLATRSVPPTPPSASAAKNNNEHVEIDFVREIRNCFRNGQFLVLTLVFSLVYGSIIFQIFVTDSLNLQGYSLKGYPIAFAALLGMFTSYIAGRVVDRTKKFKEMIVFANIAYLMCAICLRIFVTKRYEWWHDSLIVVLLIGFTQTFCAIQIPLGVEMAVEATYPTNESVSSGIVVLFGQLWLFVVYFMLEGLKSFDFLYDAPPNQNFQLSLDFWVLCALVAAVVSAFFMKPEYRRLKVEMENEKRLPVLSERF